MCDECYTLCAATVHHRKCIIISVIFIVHRSQVAARRFSSRKSMCLYYWPVIYRNVFSFFLFSLCFLWKHRTLKGWEMKYTRVTSKMTIEKKNGKLLKNTLMYFRWKQQKNNENGERYFVLCEKKMSYWDVMCTLHWENGQGPLQMDFHLSVWKKWNEWSVRNEYWIDCIDIRFFLTIFRHQYFGMYFGLWMRNNNSWIRISSDIVSVEHMNKY